MLNIPMPDISELREENQKIIKIIADDPVKFKELFEFQFAVTVTGDRDVINKFINLDYSAAGKNYFAAFHQFYTGIYFYRGGNYKSAETAFRKSFDGYYIQQSKLLNRFDGCQSFNFKYVDGTNAFLNQQSFKQSSIAAICFIE